MPTDWQNSKVSRAEWLPGRAVSPQSLWPPAESSVFRAGIGLGTAGLSPVNGSDGSQAQDVLRSAIRMGIRVFDTATVYGYAFAEVAIGAAVRAEVLDGTVTRSDVAVISKAGYLPENGSPSPLHCVEPAFLSREIAASRQRMGLCTIDAYLLHNPEEQMVAGRSGWAAVSGAFTALEAEAAQGHIGCYGIAAAEGFLEGHDAFHSLERLLKHARQTGGADHHFRVIELPISLWRREAFSTTPYTIRGSSATILELAKEAGLVVLASIPMGHGRAGHQTVEFLRALFPDTPIESPAMMALQFARSIPGVHVALPGISGLPHLMDAVALTRIPRWNLGSVTV